MSEDTTTTVRRWRRVGIGFYLAFTLTATLWTLLSLLATHCGYYRPAISGPRIRASADDADELRACHRDLNDLMVELHDKTFALQAQALKYDTDPATEWRNWSEAWRHRWQSIDRRCRLRELGGRGIRPEIDRMEAIHAALAELQLAYSGIVDRFVDQYVDRLRQLGRELKTVREMIDHRKRRRVEAKGPVSSKLLVDTPEQALNAGRAKSFPTNCSRRRARHWRPLAMPAKLPLAPPKQRFASYAIGSPAPHSARSASCREALNLAPHQRPSRLVDVRLRHGVTD